MASISSFFRVVLAIVLAVPCTALALCTDGRTPTLEQEVSEAEVVVVANVIRETVLTEDPSDPIGVTATEYRIKVSNFLRGMAQREMTVRSENTSARFPLTIGVSYLLILNRDVNGRLFVDNCGNSGTLSERKAERKALETMQRKLQTHLLGTFDPNTHNPHIASEKVVRQSVPSSLTTTQPNFRALHAVCGWESPFIRSPHANRQHKYRDLRIQICPTR